MIGELCSTPLRIHHLRFTITLTTLIVRWRRSSMRILISHGIHCRQTRRLHDTSDLDMFGTLVVAGPTPDQIFVLIPDSVGPTVDAESPVDIQHVVGLSLGSATNLSSILRPEGLHLALCDNSLRPTLGLGHENYWTEITPILRQWQSVNDASCPSCHRVIRVNMARHLRASHTQCQCFWHCPVTTCPIWFSSELNGKDHLERIHSFREGLGY